MDEWFEKIQAKALESQVLGRGLHSSTFWLNLSAFCGIGVACGGCVGVFSGGVWGCLGCTLCQERLKLS